MAEHSFRACFCWCNISTCTRISKNKHTLSRAIILITQNPHYLCCFSLELTQCLDGFSLLRQRYVRKGNDAKNPAIFSCLFVTERTQLNVTHAQLLEKLRPIALAETCRFLTIQSLEFQETWRKKKIRDQVDDLSKKICNLGIFNNTEND